MTNSNQMAQTRDKKGRITGGPPPAGFNVHPENRNPGRWDPKNTISYQYNRFMHMTPKQLKEWAKTPDDKRTVAMDLAFNRIIEARKSLPDVKEITDRTEGKAPQKYELPDQLNVNFEVVNRVPQPED